MNNKYLMYIGITAILVLSVLAICTPGAGADERYNFISKWGRGGIGEGEFNEPAGIAVDSSGNVFVADRDNNRIQKFDSDGNFITKWGVEGTGDGKFKSPMGIAVDSSGNVFVADSGNYRIQKFDSDGNFITTWGSYGRGEGKFGGSGGSGPRGIAVDSSGNVFVADGWRNDRIQKFDSDGNFITTWGSYGRGDEEFNNILGIAVDSSGNVFVADSGNDRIQKFDSDGNFITKWGEEGTGDGKFNFPRGIAIDSSGCVYVADTWNHRIQKFDSDGNFITKWGKEGTGDGKFDMHWDIAVDSSGNVYVTDSDNYRIQKFAPGKAQPTPTSTPTTTPQPSATISSQNDIFLSPLTDLLTNYYFSTSCSAITISGGITAEHDIRITFPESLQTTWGDHGPPVYAYGSAVDNGRIVSSPSFTFENDGRTVVIPVDADFSYGESVTIGELDFSTLSTAPQGRTGNLELDINNDGLADATDDKKLTVVQITVSSASDQNFQIGAPPAPMIPLTITDDTITATIKAGVPIRVDLSSDALEWDISDPAANIIGSGASKVNPTVSFGRQAYPASKRHLNIEVLEDFAPGEWITISGLNFCNFTEADTTQIFVTTYSPGRAMGRDDKKISIEGMGYPPTPTPTPTLMPTPTPTLPILCTDSSYDFGTVPEGQTRDWIFDITNCGGGTLTWTVSADQSWITVNPTSDSTTTETDTVTVSIDTTGLECGKKHTGTITVKSDGGTKQGGITVNVPKPTATWKTVELKEHIQEDLFSGEALKVWIENPAVTAIKVHFDEINTTPEWGALQILNEEGSIIWEVSVYLGYDIGSAPIYGRSFIIKIIKESESDEVSYAIDKLFYYSEDPNIIVSEDSVRHEIIDSPLPPSPGKVNIHGIQEGRINLTRPTNNEVFSYGYKITFRWKADNEGPRIQSYDFYIGTPEDVMANQVTYLLGRSYRMSTYEIERILGTERALYWCVVGRYYDPTSEESLQVRSPVWSFKVDTPDVPTVTLIAPQNNSRNVMATPRFHWKVEPFESYFYRSQVFLGKTPDSLEPLSDDPVSDFFYELDSPLEYWTTYFWQVKVFEPRNDEPIAESEVMSFRTDEEPWKEVILEEPIRRDIPPGQALQVRIGGAQQIRAHFSELSTTPYWCSIQIVTVRGKPLWDASGYIGEITSEPVGGRDIILRINKRSEVDEVSYTIDKLFYRGLKEAITADDVYITNISDPVMEYFGLSVESLSWPELESKHEDIKEERIILKRPANDSEETYGKNVRFTWVVDTEGLPFDTCWFTFYIGNSTKVYSRVVQKPSYRISAQEIERILGEDKERELYWCVKGSFFVQGQSELGNVLLRSPVQSFWIKPIVKPALTLTSPADNARDVVTRPTLHWSVTPVEPSKHLYLSYRSQVFMGKSSDSMEPLTTYPVDGSYYELDELEQPLESGTTYFWQVKLFDHVKTEPIVESQVMQFTTIGSDEAGDGTSFDDAIELSDGQTLTGNVVKGGKVYYKFHLSAGQQATVTMQPLDDDQDLYIFNPSRVQINVSGNSEKNTEECFPIADAEGYYYAKVDGFAAGSFTITLKVSGGAGEAGEGTGFDDAIALSDGQTLIGNVVTGGKVYYKFHLSAGQQATVTMQPLDDDQDLYIFNPSREQINVSGNSEKNTEECFPIADAEGYYYAKVDGFAAGSFTITLKVSGGASEAGEGTSFDDAIALSDGQTLTGNVVTGGKVYYKFYLSAGQQATVTMQPLDDDQDLYIFNPSREQINVSGNSEKNTEECFPIADAEGYYYAKVDGFAAGSFTITLKVSGGASEAGEGTGFDDAIALSDGQTLIGNVVTGGKVYYKFHLSAGQEATVTMQPQDDDQDLYIFNPSREQINVSGNSETNTEECFPIADAEGYYYAMVDGFAAGSFTITLSISCIDDTGFDDADELPGVGRFVSCDGRLEDFYKFYLSRGQTVTVTLEPSDTDRDLYVFDTSRNQIGASRNSGTEIDECTFTTDDDGYYYAKVQSNEETGCYSLAISVSG